MRLGIDLGRSHCKVAAVDAAGAEVDVPLAGRTGRGRPMPALANPVDGLWPTLRDVVGAVRRNGGDATEVVVVLDRGLLPLEDVVRGILRHELSVPAVRVVDTVHAVLAGIRFRDGLAHPAYLVCDLGVRTRLTLCTVAAGTIAVAGTTDLDRDAEADPATVAGAVREVLAGRGRSAVAVLVGGRASIESRLPAAARLRTVAANLEHAVRAVLPVIPPPGPRAGWVAALGAALVARGLVPAGDRYPAAVLVETHLVAAGRLVERQLELAPRDTLLPGAPPVFAADGPPVRVDTGTGRVRLTVVPAGAAAPRLLSVDLGAGGPPPGDYHLGVRLAADGRGELVFRPPAGESTTCSLGPLPVHDQRTSDIPSPQAGRR